jgi:hypothetical protein
MRKLGRRTSRGTCVSAVIYLIQKLLLKSTRK